MNKYNYKNAVFISFGAIIGALSRYYLTVLVKELIGQDAGFIATLAINIIGCTIIAYILTLVTDGTGNISPELRLMTTTGFCGAFTTFSAYGLETETFGTGGNSLMILLYGVGSLVLGMIGIQFGVFLARLQKVEQE